MLALGPSGSPNNFQTTGSLGQSKTALPSVRNEDEQAFYRAPALDNLL